MAESGNRASSVAVIITALAALGATAIQFYDRMDSQPGQSQPAPALQPMQFQPAAPRASAGPHASMKSLPARPSFSCDLPDHRYEAFELAICGSAELSRADRELQAAYQAARGRGNATRNTALKSIQREWMASRAGCGADPACLMSMYQQRIEALGRENR